MPPNAHDAEATETSPFLRNRSMEDARKSSEPGSGGVFQNDPEMEGLTLYEKKCVLINREVDATGMGRYQWNIWALCGFGYVLDLLWAQAFALVLGPLEQELGFPDSQSGNIQVCLPAPPDRSPALTSHECR